MNAAPAPDSTREIRVTETFPHSPEVIWNTLTSGALIARWLMKPAGFTAVVGTHFTFQTTPGGQWDGVIRCQVLEAVPNQRLVYSWEGGHEANTGYGAPLSTTVTWTLERVEGGTRLGLIHSGFVSPRNDSALKTMGEGWQKVVRNIGGIAAEQD